jgi:hypothetical protein
MFFKYLDKILVTYSKVIYNNLVENSGTSIEYSYLLDFRRKIVKQQDETF